MDLQWLLALAGLATGLMVGLTGMGGGALLTPLLVLAFNVSPLTAVSSDLLAALVMKPVGGAVHLRHGTVNRRLVGFLVLGSVPSAFAGVLVLRALGDSKEVQRVVTLALGAALLLAATTMVVKAVLALAERTRTAASGPSETPLAVRPLPTVGVGALGGLVVGMTSVGSGSLIIVLLLLLYPRLRANDLVGTDLVQAVPLVGAAALGHLLFGSVSLGLTASLLVGSVPGAYLGARLSTRAPQRLIRRLLVVVLVASGLKLLGVPAAAVGVVILALGVVGPLGWMLLRGHYGLSRVPRRAGRAAAPAPVASSSVPG